MIAQRRMQVWAAGLPFEESCSSLVLEELLLVLLPSAAMRCSDFLQLAPGILDGKFSLSAEEVQRLLRDHGLSEDELLRLLITPASQLARPPISSFRVG